MSKLTNEYNIVFQKLGIGPENSDLYDTLTQITLNLKEKQKIEIETLFQ